MARSSDTLPVDLNELDAMLVAERIGNRRLVQIIEELQRHRYGRRGETLPENQTLLALEEVEQENPQTSSANASIGATSRDTNASHISSHTPAGLDTNNKRRCSPDTSSRKL
jgi:transposase